MCGGFFILVDGVQKVLVVLFHLVELITQRRCFVYHEFKVQCVF